MNDRSSPEPGAAAHAVWLQDACAALRRTALEHMDTRGTALRPGDLVTAARAVLAPAPDPRVLRRYESLAARVLRQLLVDCADAGRAPDAPSGPAVLASGPDADAQIVDVRTLDRALTRLARHDRRAAEILELILFGGATEDRIAVLLDLPAGTVAQDARWAMAWLRRELNRRG